MLGQGSQAACVMLSRALSVSTVEESSLLAREVASGEKVGVGGANASNMAKVLSAAICLALATAGVKGAWVVGVGAEHGRRLGLQTGALDGGGEAGGWADGVAGFACMDGRKPAAAGCGGV